MVKVKKCSFCQYDIPIGRGVMYVKKDGTILNFCTNKCKKAMINYKHLRYFWAVAKEGGVARASERLNLTPQTISGQLRSSST